METRTAYCKHCKQNTPVVDTMSQQQINTNIIVVVVYFVIMFGLMTAADIMGGEGFASATLGTWLFILGVPAFVLIAGVASSKNKLYCSKCGLVVGTKTNAKPKCMHCYADMESGATFCPFCGKRYRDNVDSIVCKRCKTENSHKSAFCTKCGANLQKLRAQARVKQKSADLSKWSDWK